MAANPGRGDRGRGGRGVDDDKLVFKTTKGVGSSPSRISKIWVSKRMFFVVYTSTVTRSPPPFSRGRSCRFSKGEMSLLKLSPVRERPL